MARASALGGALLTLLALTGAAAPAAAAPAGPGPVAVRLEQRRLATVLGDEFTLVSHLSNRGGTPTGELIAHVDLESLTGEVYVDPEDWSAERTAAVPPLRPGETVTVRWRLQAVNWGSFLAYVVVLPKDPAAPGGEPLVVSPAVRVDVAGRRTLDIGLALPVVVATPVLLALLVVTVRRRIRRRG